MTRNRRIAAVTLALTAGLGLSGCATEADTVDINMDQAAENFELNRRIVFFNGITDTYLLTIEGRCNVLDEGGQLEVLCKIADGQSEGAYKRHLLGLSDNVTYFVEALETVEVGKYNHRVMFRPEVIIPDVDVETSVDLERDGNSNR